LAISLAHLSGEEGVILLILMISICLSALKGGPTPFPANKCRQAIHIRKLSGDVIVRFLIKKYIYQLTSLCCYEKNNKKTPSPLSYNFLLLENNIYLTVSEQKIICMAESLYIFSIFTCGVTNIK
jgi:hypothetical protein